MMIEKIFVKILGVVVGYRCSQHLLHLPSNSAKLIATAIVRLTSPTW